MNTVIKPISLFLNDIEKNYLHHNPANAKGVSNYDIVDKSYLSSYTSSGGTYKFTAYDLRNFLIKDRSRTLFK
jgi:hypothetical protein